MNQAAAGPVATIAWPSFLMACVMEGLVFAFVDPAALHIFGLEDLANARAGVYTVSFFLFWAVIATAVLISRALSGGPKP